MSTLPPRPAPALSARDLVKAYALGGETVRAVDQVTIEVQRGEIVAIVGPSGCGKSTLLSLLAGLELPDSGEVVLDGTRLRALDEDARAVLRRREVGFIFQTFNLVPVLSLRENAALPWILDGEPERVWGRAVDEALARVGLTGRARHLPDQASVGEQQRAAIARAIATRPGLLFADEPTGSLDSARGDQILELLLGLRSAQQTTVVLVTHDPALAARADRVLEMRDGRLSP